MKWWMLVESKERSCLNLNVSQRNSGKLSPQRQLSCHYVRV